MGLFKLLFRRRRRWPVAGGHTHRSFWDQTRALLP